MSATRCACPACHKPISVPDDIIGKKVRCPGCHTVLLSKAIGGKTTLARVSGSAKTEAMAVKTKQAIAVQVPEEVEEVEEVQARPAPKRSLVWLWISIAAAAVVLLGGLGVVVLAWSMMKTTTSKTTQAVVESTHSLPPPIQQQPNKPAPAIEHKVEQPAQPPKVWKTPPIEYTDGRKELGIEFKSWKVDNKRGDKIVGVVKPTKMILERVSSYVGREIQISVYDKNELKIAGASLSHPNLQQGESGKIEVTVQSVFLLGQLLAPFIHRIPVWTNLLVLDVGSVMRSSHACSNSWSR